jgi:uncharacterized protein (UPF0335 family)
MSEPGIGDNSGEPALTLIRAIVERVERLAEEKEARADDIREVYAEAKGSGLDVKALRELVKLRKQDRDNLREFEEILDLYRAAIGLN